MPNGIPITPSDASVLAYELRDLHKVMATYKGGVVFEPDSMPWFLGMLDDLAQRAERILQVEDQRHDRADHAVAVSRIDALIDDLNAEARTTGAAADAITRRIAVLEGVASGKVAVLRCQQEGTSP